MTSSPGAIHLAGLRGTVGVIGLSKTGEAVARALLNRGVAVRIIEELYERERMSEMHRRLEADGCEIHTGTQAGSGVDALAGCSLIVTSPGVPPHSQILKAASTGGIEVWSEVELAYCIYESDLAAGDRSKLVAVTGTNGKTTVVSMITEVARTAGLNAIACGNIGFPLIKAVTTSGPDTIFIAEVSSFQLYFTLRFKPNVSVVLNFAPDHMDWHAGIEEYASAKGKIFLNQTKGDYSVWNAGDSGANRIAEMSMASDVTQLPFIASQGVKGAVCVDSSSVVSPAGQALISLDSIPNRSKPTLENVLAACAVAYCLEISGEAVACGIEGFSSPAHRIEKIATTGGVEFVDDSKATNPHASKAAIASFDSVILIAGGHNKGLDLREIHGYGDATIVRRIKAVVAMGEAAAAVTEAFRDTAIPVFEAMEMASAVEQAAAVARPGDVVLLSPGCASFDAYSNYAERGDDFKAAVMKLARSSHAIK